MSQESGMTDKRFGKPRPSGEPSESVDRKIRILLELVRNKFVTVSRLCEQFEMSERSLLRDFQELRRIGETAGFTLTEKIENDQIRLIKFDLRPTAIEQKGRAMQTLIADALGAFGEPLQQQLQTLSSNGQPHDERRFLKFLLPKLLKGSHVAEVYNDLEAAWLASARVSFTYSDKPRTVEPAAVFVRSNRYYLLARDPKSRDWKYFALDKIETPIARSGSYAPQPIPERYLSNDVIGFLKGEGKGEHRVSVRLSASVATSALSREWQHVQEIQHNGDGSATITFTVSDVGEVVRWALGFGAEAQIVAPGHAIEMARGIAEQIWRAYD